MEAAHQEMSQAEFARKMKVSRAAVSQWKANDILRDDAFTKPGKKGKIIYQVAVDHVRRYRDIGQSLGNGIGTRTSTDETDAPAPSDPEPFVPHEPEGQPGLPLSQEASAEPQAPQVAVPDASERTVPKANTIEDDLKRVKLERDLRQNRKEAEEEAFRKGLLMSADEARDQMTRIAVMMMQIFEGALPDFAAAMADRFDVPQRDVLHLLRAEFVKVRKTAAMKERARADETEKNVTTSVEMDA